MDFTVLVVCLLIFAGSGNVFAQKRQELNGRCRHVSECSRIGYFCSSNRTCQCAPGYLPNEEWTKCIGFIGSKCAYDSHCIEGAFCTVFEGREVCMCKTQDDYFPSDDFKTCLSSATTFGGFAVLTITLWTLLNCVT